MLNYFFMVMGMLENIQSVYFIEENIDGYNILQIFVYYIHIYVFLRLTQRKHFPAIFFRLIWYEIGFHFFLRTFFQKKCTYSKYANKVHECSLLSLSQGGKFTFTIRETGGPRTDGKRLKYLLTTLEHCTITIQKTA